MEQGKQWPRLYKTGSNGKELQWDIRIEPAQNSDAWRIITNHGQVDGEIQESVASITMGKNVGRANETTIRQQAESEAQSKWTKQHDKGYAEVRGGAKREFAPMLAHEFGKHKKKVQFDNNVYIQPKLDGQRCIAWRDGNTITLQSRNGKPIAGLDHIRQELLKVMEEGQILDGELYHHELTFQQVISFVKKSQPGSEQIQYHVYDSIRDGSFADRFIPLSNRLHSELGRNSCVQVVTTLKVIETGDKALIEVKTLHDSWVSEGYEGAMIRHGGCEYRQAARSDKLLKFKEFQQEEFEIVDVVPNGRYTDMALFVCKAASGAQFNANPQGTEEVRRQYLLDRDKLVGKQLTVRFFELTTSEPPVPRFPIGVAVRDYE